MQSLLTILILLPVVGAATAVVYSLTPGARESHHRWIALGFTTLSFLISLLLISGSGSALGAFRFEENYPWIAAIGARYHLGVDGISLWLVVLTTLLMPIAVLSSWTAVTRRQTIYYALMLLLESAMIGVFVSLDLLLFYLFFEASLVPMFFLIGIWGGERRIYAAVKFFIYTAVGSLLMLVGIIAIYFIHQQATGIGTFDYVVLMESLRSRLMLIAPRTEVLLFAAFAFAFCIKVPLWPFHTWLPDAHTEAPTAGSVILAGVLLKMGTYGLLRFNFGLFPNASRQMAPLIITLAIIGIIYGALVAMVQPDVKRLVAYSSVSHMGFVVLGLFSFTEQGMQGALYQMLNHGVSTGALFLFVGMIYERRHTRMISDFGGLARPMPWFSALFVIASLSSIGLPFLNGFVGEFLIMLGSWTTTAVSHPWIVTMLAGTGVIWAAVYMLWMLQRVVFGTKTSEVNARLSDLNAREIGLLLPLLGLMLFMGVYPQTFLNRSRASIEAMRQVVSGPSVAPASVALDSRDSRDSKEFEGFKQGSFDTKMIRAAQKLFLATIILLTLLSVAGAQTKDLPGEPLLKLQGLDGKVYDLSELRGSVVLVSFGATWCAPCSTELRALEEILSEYREKPVKFFWVSIERPEEITNAALRRYARERKVSFPVLRDTAKMVFLQFTPRVRLPMIVMLGKDGKVDAPVQFGMRAPLDAYKDDMRARLNKLLTTRVEGDR